MDILEEAARVASAQEKKYTNEDIFELQVQIIQFMARLVMEQKIALGDTTNGGLELLYQQLPGVFDAVKNISQMRKENTL